MRLASHGTSESLQVALNLRTPLLKARRRQVPRQPTVKPPRAPLGAVLIGDHRPPDDFELISHARQKPVELLVAQTDFPAEELADTRLPHTANTRQL